MTAPGLQRLEEELRQLKSAERPSIIRADRRGPRARRSVGKRRVPRRARAPVLHRGPHRRARGGDRLGRGDRHLHPVGRACEVRRHGTPGRRGDRQGSELPDRRPARGRHQGPPAVDDLAAGQGADRQEGRRDRFGAGAGRRPLRTRSWKSASRDRACDRARRRAGGGRAHRRRGAAHARRCRPMPSPAPPAPRSC